MGLDFEANKPRMYSELRVKMGELGEGRDTFR